MKRWSTNPYNEANGGLYPDQRDGTYPHRVNFARIGYISAQLFVEDELSIADQSPDDFYLGVN